MTMNQYLFIHKTKTSMIKIFMKYHFFQRALEFLWDKVLQAKEHLLLKLIMGTKRLGPAITLEEGSQYILHSSYS